MSLQQAYIELHRELELINPYSPYWDDKRGLPALESTTQVNRYVNALKMCIRTAKKYEPACLRIFAAAFDKIWNNAYKLMNTSEAAELTKATTEIVKALKSVKHDSIEDLSEDEKCDAVLAFFVNNIGEEEGKKLLKQCADEWEKTSTRGF